MIDLPRTVNFIARASFLTNPFVKKGAHIFHNLVAHPLLLVLPKGWGELLHDVTADIAYGVAPVLDTTSLKLPKTMAVNDLSGEDILSASLIHRGYYPEADGDAIYDRGDGLRKAVIIAGNGSVQFTPIRDYTLSLEELPSSLQVQIGSYIFKRGCVLNLFAGNIVTIQNTADLALSYEYTLQLAREV